MDGDQLSLDTVFDLLSHSRRRHALAVLGNYDEPMTLADLADEVAVRQHEASLDEISAEEVADIYFRLYHKDVPKLTAADVVAYDQERDLVAADDNLDQCLEHFPARDE
ncbi:hypothetical protein BRC81_13565 [Halobacteriales archaeon QS_1_68_20]|nr:MAG: hypothetical protein BRC81_13565 [Halobacteriales archaeon QS_1_68_20]